MTPTYEPVTCRGGPVTNRMVTREKDNGVEGRKGGVVEKLHPAHCIENLNEEEEEKEKGRGAGGKVEEKGGGGARRVSGVVGTPKIASRYDDARSGPILDFSQFASSKAAGYTRNTLTTLRFHLHRGD